MMQMVVIEEGGIACNAGCPYYEPSGVVRCHGGPKKSHCLAIMEPWSFDCSKFNPKRMWKLKVTEAQFKAMVKSQGLRPVKQRKLYPVEHKEIHHIGDNTRAKIINRKMFNKKKGDNNDEVSNDSE